jgi:hypothetical protein
MAGSAWGRRTHPPPNERATTAHRRSNSPLLRVRRSVLLAGFTLDGAGFAPPLRVEGGAGVQPLLQVGGHVRAIDEGTAGSG